MKVILRSEVKDLGQEGDVLEVASGYGRNYLFPQGLAVEATAQNLKQLQSKIRAREEQKKEELEVARELGGVIAEKTVVVRAKTGGRGKLFGSITNSEIADKLQEQHGIEVDKRKIDLKSPLKETGFYTIKVKLHPEVAVDLKVHVEAEQEPKAEKEPKAETKTEKGSRAKKARKAKEETAPEEEVTAEAPEAEQPQEEETAEPVQEPEQETAPEE